MTAHEIKKVTDELYQAWEPMNPNMPTEVSTLQATWETAYQLAVMNERAGQEREQGKCQEK